MREWGDGGGEGGMGGRSMGYGWAMTPHRPPTQSLPPTPPHSQSLRHASAINSAAATEFATAATTEEFIAITTTPTTTTSTTAAPPHAHRRQWHRAAHHMPYSVSTDMGNTAAKPLCTTQRLNRYVQYSGSTATYQMADPTTRYVPYSVSTAAHNTPRQRAGPRKRVNR